MNKRNLLIAGGTVALSLALIALPAPPANSQYRDDSRIARLQQKIEELQAKLQAELENRQVQDDELAGTELLGDSVSVLNDEDLQEVQQEPGTDTDGLNIVFGDEGSSWLGVETQEVSADKAKQLKLSAERGVVIGKVVPDSPAAKAGLKENDVVTEVNGQRVEGAAQFRRMIREIPAGRAVQLGVWRDGRAQTISVTLGKSEEGRHALRMLAPSPGIYSFHMPEIPPIPPMEWNGTMLQGGQPRLGVDAEDLSGQLGNFFGAPEGEGILVREVHEGSPAEKAGVKAGDVIVSINGERIRSIGELREKLSAKRDEKDRTIKLGVLRNKSEVSLTVELPAPAPRTRHFISHRTNI